MNLYESIKNSRNKLTESVNGFIHAVWGPEASEDNLDDNERWELVGLVNSIENTEDEYNDGKLSLDDFIEIIEEECKAHGLSDEETKTAADFYRKSYTDDEPEDEDGESFIMHNDNSDKDVRVWKQDGKWYDEEGNRYMGYLSKQDVKNYFKGNWHEVKEAEEVFLGSQEFKDKYKDIINYDHIDDFIDKYEDEIYQGLDSIYHGYLFPNDEVYLSDINEDYIYEYIGTHMQDKFNEFVKQHEMKESDDWNTYDVNVGFAGYIGVEQEYHIQARNKNEAVFHALDEQGSEAEQDLNVENVEDNGDGSYDVEVNFAGLESNTYTETADSQEDAENLALGDAKNDLEIISVDGEEYNYDDADGYVTNESELKESYCILNYWDPKGNNKEKIFNAGSPKALVSKVKRFVDNKCDPMNVISIHQASSDVANDEYLNSLGEGVLRSDHFSSTFESELKETKDDEPIETLGLGAGSYPTPPEVEMTTVSGNLIVTYEFETEIPKSWNYEQLLDDIRENLSEYQEDLVDFEVDCSYEGPQDYEDRRADEQYDEERINND